MSKNPTPPQAKEWRDRPTKLRLREAAAYLGVGYSTIRRFIAYGLLGCESLGYRTKFVYLSELEAFLKQRNTKSYR